MFNCAKLKKGKQKYLCNLARIIQIRRNLNNKMDVKLIQSLAVKKINNVHIIVK